LGLGVLEFGDNEEDDVEVVEIELVRDFLSDENISRRDDADEEHDRESLLRISWRDALAVEQF